ncbi:GntR family transcriptional regulator [Leucobacter sp. cx-328]|uniref:GntR family transcriptional regulator n=1 Tax=unclassified Leucobacter TaxID=2621730 RepID=UPI00165D4196|nr:MULTISPECIES: GntR family transcriptional regulator [unclassified Leucobacter]MBC9944941.1 GntR family transcriptional regulator [Leucobacter sp. cx-328]
MQIDDSRPIWAQLVDEFRQRIVAGTWPPGGKLPSVRELALDVGVNPNTVQKALAEVDRLGLTVTERTAGRFVSTDAAAIAEARAALAATKVTDFAASMAAMGMTLEQASELLTQLWNDREDAS